MAESDDCYPLKMSIRCELCNYKSNRKSNFDRHMKSMHEECDRPIQCCGQVFVNKASLKKHSHQFHREGYRCDEKSCNKVFPRKALLRRHQTVHNGIKEFSCADCVYETSHKSNLERHCFRVHNLIIGNSDKYSKSDKNKIALDSWPNASQSSQISYQSSSTNSESELSSSQELVSSQELSHNNGFNTNDPSIVSHTQQMTPKSLSFDIKQEVVEEVVEEVLPNDYSKLIDEDLKCDNHKKLRLCLRPYKCLICWVLFESQLEYFEHQILTDHMVKDSEQLEVIKAAAVLTQFSISSKSRSVSKDLDINSQSSKFIQSI